LQSSIGAFFIEETKTVNFYSTLSSGQWQNPQNVQGPPDVGPTGDINSFSETNSAIYKKGPLHLISENFTTDEDFTNYNFQSAKIRFSFAFGEKKPDFQIFEKEAPTTSESGPTSTWIRIKNFFTYLFNRVTLIAKAQESNTTTEVIEATRTEETATTEATTSEITTTTATSAETLPNLDTRIIIWWSLDGESWQKLNTISDYPLSNKLNGGYFELDAPFLKNWDDFKNLKIKFEGVVGGETNLMAYLDSAWVEAEYQQPASPAGGQEASDQQQGEKVATTTEATTTEATTTEMEATTTEATATEATTTEATTTEKLIKEKKPKIKIKDNSLLINLFEKSFPADEEPTFEIKEPEINLQEIIDTEKGELIEGKIISSNIAEVSTTPIATTTEATTTETTSTASTSTETTTPDTTSTGTPVPDAEGPEGEQAPYGAGVGTGRATTIEATSTYKESEASPISFLNKVKNFFGELVNKVEEKLAYLRLVFKQFTASVAKAQEATTSEATTTEATTTEATTTEATTSTETEFTPLLTIKIFDPQGSESQTQPQIFSQKVNGKEKFEIKLPKERNFKPGKWKMEIELETKEAIFVMEQDFTWGVLAINVNKSIYLPGEQAYLQMAALRDDGHTICDANLKLEVISPIGQITRPEVQRSGQCGPDNVTDVPDYFAYYQVDGVGTYQMKLINLDTGYEIEDSFEVRDSVPFDVERIGPTRIYPPATYEMRLIIKVNQDFEGVVKEYVPESFKITIDNLLIYEINRVDEIIKVISWNVTWKAGEMYELKYQFDAPDISPYLYLLGPLRFEQ